MIGLQLLIRTNSDNLQDEHLDDEASMADTKEGLYFSSEMAEDDPRPLLGANQWPPEVCLHYKHYLHIV